MTAIVLAGGLCVCGVGVRGGDLGVWGSFPMERLGGNVVRFKLCCLVSFNTPTGYGRNLMMFMIFPPGWYDYYCDCLNGRRSEPIVRQRCAWGLYYCRSSMTHRTVSYPIFFINLQCNISYQTLTFLCVKKIRIQSKIIRHPTIHHSNNNLSPLPPHRKPAPNRRIQPLQLRQRRERLVSVEYTDMEIGRAGGFPFPGW